MKLEYQNCLIEDVKFSDTTKVENKTLFIKTNCQIKCNTYGKKPKSSSLGVLYCIHFLGLLFIKLKL